MTRGVPVASSTTTTIGFVAGFAGSYCRTYQDRPAGLNDTSNFSVGLGTRCPWLSVTVTNFAPLLVRAIPCTWEAVSRGLVGPAARGDGTGTIESNTVLVACAS